MWNDGHVIQGRNKSENQTTEASNIKLLDKLSIVLGAFAVVVAVVLFGTGKVAVDTNNAFFATKTIWIVAYWSLAQWIPRILYDDTHHQMNSVAWNFWESDHYSVLSSTIKPKRDSFLVDIPMVNVQDHAIDDILPFIESKYGKNWKQRPLLLKGLWKLDELMMTNNSSSSINKRTYRRLSLHGLLQENLTIPYFTDARKVGAITPDGIGTIKDIITNITYHNAPHKIATQLLLQTYPELIEEVAPLSILTKLFDYHHFTSSSSLYFSPNSIRGSNSPMQMFPKLTTVPLFVANSHPAPRDTTSGNNIGSNDMQSSSILPHTALHCEPIGNVAVQLSGEKLWTLIRPEYSTLLRPYIAPDGRAFFASSLPISQITKNDGNIPYYQVITEAGDALWVPTWTWHRVDYVKSSSSSSSLPNARAESTASSQHNENEYSSNIAIGASIFHFRPLEFLQNNPLYSLLIVPAIVLELIGFKTQ
jgi:Cupin-like domain